MICTGDTQGLLLKGFAKSIRGNIPLREGWESFVRPVALLCMQRRHTAGRQRLPALVGSAACFQQAALSSCSKVRLLLLLLLPAPVDTLILHAPALAPLCAQRYHSWGVASLQPG